MHIRLFHVSNDKHDADRTAILYTCMPTMSINSLVNLRVCLCFEYSYNFLHYFVFQRTKSGSTCT